MGEMEIAVPSAHGFSSTASTPYVSAPSSPKRFADPFDCYYHYTSAPASPKHVAAIWAASGDPYGWELDSSTAESSVGGGNNDGAGGAHDFAFEFSGQLEKGGQPPDLTAADELFERGKIRPLNETGAASARRLQRGVEAARERGREAGPTSPSIPSSRSRKVSRSLSPMRSGAGSFLVKAAASSATSDSVTATPAAGKTASERFKNGGGSRKWRLRDLLLFRSASEGRATGSKSKDPLRKFTAVPSPPIISAKNGGADSRNSSFRSADSVGGSTRRARVSAHEMHYTSNRAASEEMKRKTALPFSRQGLFGCLRFNPAVHSIAKGFHDGFSSSPRQ